MRAPSLSLPARFFLLVLFVVVAPLTFMGYWLAGSAARSGEQLLRSRLTASNVRAAAEMGGNWVPPRSALLSFAEQEAVQTELTVRRDRPRTATAEEADSVEPPPSLINRFDSLPASITEIKLVDTDGRDVWHFARASAALPTFSVRLPVHARAAPDSLGWIEARLTADAVLSGEGSSGTSGAVLAVIDPVSGASLRALPFDPSALSSALFDWDGARWAAERWTLEEPRLEVISAAPLAEFSAPFEATARQGLVILLAVTLAATALAAVLTRRMTRSLGELAVAADAVSRGELGVRVEAGGGSEVARVAQAFNRMAESLRRTLDELAQRESLAAVGRFASELAHEVRNPLTSIKLDLQFLGKGLPEGSEAQTVQKNALDEVVRLDRAVAGVLQVARSGRIELAETDLRDPLAVAARAVESIVGRSRAALRVNLPEEPLVILGDRTALQQLFTNLLANAAQAVGEEGKVELLATTNGKGTVVVVRDDGRGIAPTDLARVREPFFTTREEGTGLGLAIAERIVAAHQGELTIESAAGRGTVITVTFPARV